MTEVDFEYTVRPATDADRGFVLETTARVRQPHGMNWRDWEPYGWCWANRWSAVMASRCWVVDAAGVLLGFVLLGLSAERSVEMLYVKAQFRGLSFGQVLLDAAGMPDVVPCRAPTDSWRMWASRRKIRFTVVK